MRGVNAYLALFQSLYILILSIMQPILQY